jgi:hypothetical protein
LQALWRSSWWESRKLVLIGHAERTVRCSAQLSRTINSLDTASLTLYTIRMILFDEENNIIIPESLRETQEGRAVISQMIHLRLLVAAELARCGIHTSLDGLLDDAGTVIGVLNRSGHLSFERTS